MKLLLAFLQPKLLLKALFESEMLTTHHGSLQLIPFYRNKHYTDFFPLSLSLSSFFFITNTFISFAYNRKTKKKANNMNNLLNDYNHQNIPHFQLGFVTAKRRKRKKRKKIISIDKMWMWCTCGFYAENMSEEANIKAYCKINCCFVSCSSI